VVRRRGHLHCPAGRAVPQPDQRGRHHRRGRKHPADQFIFELGTNLKDQHPLDFLAIHYIRSTPTSHYLTPDAARPRPGPQPGLLQQDALREWFVRRFNAVADHLIRIENFRTKSGELRPEAMQERSMHVSRILNVTAHLLAAREQATRFSGFWDLFDLYGTLMGGPNKVFAEPHWRKDILPCGVPELRL
jgi:hypothetical protein